MSTNRVLWTLWLASSLAAAAFLAYGLSVEKPPAGSVAAAAKTLLLPGPTTSAHYQIELACESCHGDGLGGAEVLQNACVDCHGSELKQVDDSHPKSKFTDPRNADRVAILDARYCVTCHVEHKPEITNAMAVTLPDDYCVDCHRDVGENRPSHQGMAFNTCASAGCHNFHDNQALYEDFLVKHANQPDQLAQAELPARQLGKLLALLDDYPSERYPIKPLTAAHLDAPRAAVSDEITKDWLASRHAASGVNCSACHQP